MKGHPVRVILLLTLLFLFISQPLVHPADSDIPYAARIPYRIARGITNVALGWTEIFLRPFGEIKTETIGEAIAQGAAHGLSRTGLGFQDVFTCWMPDMQMLDLYPDWQGWPYLFHWS